MVDCASVHRQEDGQRAGRRRQAADRCGRDPDARGAEREERRRPVGQAGRHRDGAGSRSGTSLVEGASVRINYSTGPKQVAVPPVVGLDYSTALQQLQAAGFAVARTDVESDQPAGVVVSQVPSGSSTATKGSTVNLSVSNGPQTTPLPDVTGQTEADAKATLTAAGFKVEGDTAGHRRGDVRRGRDLAGSAGEHAAGSEHDRDALRRQRTCHRDDDSDATRRRHDDAPPTTTTTTP